MRLYLILLAILLLVGIIAFKEGASSQKHKNFKAERYSAEWGCLTGGHRACEYLGEPKMYACMDYMREKYCPEAADAFERFMSQSYKGPSR